MSLLSIHVRDEPSKLIFTPNRQLTRTSGDILRICFVSVAPAQKACYSMACSLQYGRCWVNINKQMLEALKRL